MKSSLSVMALAAAVMVFCSVQTVEARGNNSLYASLIAQHCKAVSRDVSQRFHELPGYIHKQTVQIRDVRRLSRGWVRVYGVAQSSGRAAFGHMDYNQRTGQVRCPAGNWTSNYLPLWQMMRRR